MNRKQDLPVGAGCSNGQFWNLRRSKSPLFREMTYAAMISKSAKCFGAWQLATIHVVEPRGLGNLTGAIKHSFMHAEILDLLEALGVLICSGLNGHQRGCDGGGWVSGLRYAQTCDCAWT